uniref:FZ domain-containing protein n=1 Tax=Branchiostoma floridae TaxID=7739 RepID=C3ZDY0_BRAFL|eukprot:XP_002592925.1 hypothetical protein BRAFLDRAFT_117756 [Branchiostoma floridae]
MWALRHCRHLLTTHDHWSCPWREKIGVKSRAVETLSDVEAQNMAGKSQEISETHSEQEVAALMNQGGSIESSVPPSIEPHSMKYHSIEQEPPSIEPQNPSMEPHHKEPLDPATEPHSIETLSIEPWQSKEFEAVHDSERTRREPLWTEAEMERFWGVLEPHVRWLSAGEAAVPVCTIELVDPGRGLSPCDLRFCMWDIQELIWDGRYSQALAGLRRVRELANTSWEGQKGDSVMFLSEEKDEVELFKELFMKFEPVSSVGLKLGPVQVQRSRMRISAVLVLAVFLVPLVVVAGDTEERRERKREREERRRDRKGGRRGRNRNKSFPLVASSPSPGLDMFFEDRQHALISGESLGRDLGRDPGDDPRSGRREPGGRKKGKGRGRKKDREGRRRGKGKNRGKNKQEGDAVDTTPGPSPAGSKADSSKPGEVSGYSKRWGDCPGDVMTHLQLFEVSLEECAKKCNEHFDCAGFLYFQDPFNKRCFPKNRSCEVTTRVDEHSWFYHKVEHKELPPWEDRPVVEYLPELPRQSSCEPLTVPLCQNMMYNETVFPNILGHTKQDEASLEVHQYYPLVKMGCSDVLEEFLCFVYTPPCTILESPIPPCRSLCESARGSCEGLMMKFGFPWPENLDCSKFPEENQGPPWENEPGSLGLDRSLCLKAPERGPEDIEAPPVPGYEGRVGDCPGNEIWTLYGNGIILEECARRCTDEEDCAAFMYSEGSCYPKYETCQDQAAGSSDPTSFIYDKVTGPTTAKLPTTTLPQTTTTTQKTTTELPTTTTTTKTTTLPPTTTTTTEKTTVPPSTTTPLITTTTTTTTTMAEPVPTTMSKLQPEKPSRSMGGGGNMMSAMRLRRDLMSSYDKAVIPQTEADKPVLVELGMSAQKILDLDKERDILHIHTWLTMVISTSASRKVVYYTCCPEPYVEVIFSMLKCTYYDYFKAL